MNINYILFHLSGMVEKAIKENDEKKLDEISKKLRRLTEDIDIHYCIKLDSDGDN